MKKIIYITIGMIGVGLGFLGAILPLIPAFPFLLVSAYCFGKSSEKLDKWFKNTNLYKNNLEDFVSGQGMTKKAKIRVLSLISALMAIGFICMGNVPVGRIVLVFVWVFHIVYFVKFVETKSEIKND